MTPTASPRMPDIAHLAATLARANIPRNPMTAQLKISKKMAALLAELPAAKINAKIAAEVEAGRDDKTGAVMIEACFADTTVLQGFAAGSIQRLNIELEKAADGPDKHRLMGEHSAWRALLRQMPPSAPDGA